MPLPFALTLEQLAEFDRFGHIYLPGFYDQADIAAMAGRLWSDLGKRYGILADDATTWTVERPAKFQALKRSGAFDLLDTPDFHALADTLLGKGSWRRPEQWGQPLVTFPSTGPSLSQPGWHLDITGTERINPLPTLRTFVFLEPVLPNGGGTLYVAGSHKLAMELEQAKRSPVKSAQVCDWLKARDPWFAKLLPASIAQARDMIGVEATVAEYPVCLRELVGNPGDVVILHPAILHGVADNQSPTPRMMLTEWISSAAQGA